MATVYDPVNRAEQAKNLAILRAELEPQTEQQPSAAGWIALAVLLFLALAALVVLKVVLS